MSGSSGASRKQSLRDRIKEGRIKMKQRSKQIDEEFAVELVEEENTIVQDCFGKIDEIKHVFRGNTGLVLNDLFESHKCEWDENYPECPDRYRRIMARMNQMGLIERCIIITPTPIDRMLLLSVHSANMVYGLLNGSGCNSVSDMELLSSMYDAVFINEHTYNCASLAAGGCVELVSKILNGDVYNGMALVRPPGHHAMQKEYCGYCFFNNAALAAKHALDTGKVKRVLIVDWDVHHGQGTQQIFIEDDRVLYFSIHRYEHAEFWPNLPESNYDTIGKDKGEGYNINVPINDVGLTDSDYIQIFNFILMPCAYEFSPDLVIISAGYDAAYGCPEGEMLLSPAVFAHFTSFLMTLSQGKVAVLLEGGYNLDSLSESAALTLRTLLGDPVPTLPSMVPPKESTMNSILNVMFAHRKYWKCMHWMPKYKHEEKLTEESCRLQKKHWVRQQYYYTPPKVGAYETRNCYPVQSAIQLEDICKYITKLSLETKLTFPSNKLAIMYNDRVNKHRHADNYFCECPDRITEAMTKIREYNILQSATVCKGRAATKKELMLVHSKAYLTELEKVCKKHLKKNYESVYTNVHSMEAASYAAGMAIEAVDEVLSERSMTAFAVIRPPGHHAEKTDAKGFCFFNNVSIAAKHALQKYKLERILIVDFDVHHGNGTQNIFYGEEKVLFISIHRHESGKYYPKSNKGNYDRIGTGRGTGYNINIPWQKAGVGDAEYLAAFTRVVLPVAYQFNPQLVLVSAGFDAAINDPLGKCKVSPEMFGWMAFVLKNVACGKIVMLLEGGYNVTSVSHCVAMCCRSLIGEPLPLITNERACWSADFQINAVLDCLSKHWKVLNYNREIPDQIQESAIIHKRPELNEIGLHAMTFQTCTDAWTLNKKRSKSLDRLNNHSLKQKTVYKEI